MVGTNPDQSGFHVWTGTHNFKGPVRISTDDSNSFIVEPAITLYGSSNQIKAQPVTNGSPSSTALILNFAAPSSASRTITFPDPGANGDVVYTVSNQTIGGNKTFSGNTSFNGNVTLGDASTDVIILTAVINSTITSQATSNQLIFTHAHASNKITFNISAPSAARTITFPDPGEDCNVVYTALSQTIGGDKTFSGNTTFNGNVTLGDAATDRIITTKGTVTQTPAITSGVTVNATSGIITTVSTTLAADATAVFTVTNSVVTSSSIVLANIIDYSGNTNGSEGTPNIAVDNITNGAFDIWLMNPDSAHALNGVLKIAFLVIN